MLRTTFCWSLVLATCVLAGCGANGLQPGIPADTNTPPYNPTPDMGPNPPVAPAKK
jgi:hypothetical protein